MGGDAGVFLSGPEVGVGSGECQPQGVSRGSFGQPEDSFGRRLDMVASFSDSQNDIRPNSATLRPRASRVPNTIAIAVGTAIAGRPPHRSVREELPHTAPPLGRTIAALTRWHQS